MTGKGTHPIELRVQALALATYGVRYTEVSEITGISLRAVYDIVKRAKERGFNAEVDARIRREYVETGGKREAPSNEEDTPETVESPVKRREGRRARRDQAADAPTVKEGQCVSFHVLRRVWPLGEPKCTLEDTLGAWTKILVEAMRVKTES